MENGHHSIKTKRIEIGRELKGCVHITLKLARFAFDLTLFSAILFAVSTTPFVGLHHRFAASFSRWSYLISKIASPMLAIAIDQENYLTRKLLGDELKKADWTRTSGGSVFVASLCLPSTPTGSRRSARALLETFSSNRFKLNLNFDSSLLFADLSSVAVMPTISLDCQKSRIAHIYATLQTVALPFKLASSTQRRRFAMIFSRRSSLFDCQPFMNLAYNLRRDFQQLSARS